MSRVIITTVNVASMEIRDGTLTGDESAAILDQIIERMPGEDLVHWLRGETMAAAILRAHQYLNSKEAEQPVGLGGVQ